MAMRIECFKDEIQLVAICSNPSLHQDIAFASHDLLDSLESLTEHKPVFKSIPPMRHLIKITPVNTLL